MKGESVSVRFTAAVKSSIKCRDDRNRLFVGARETCKCMHGKGLIYQMKRHVLCVSSNVIAHEPPVLINAENQLVKHSNEKSSIRRADSSRRGSAAAAAAFGAPRNEFGDGGGHLGSVAAAAWLGGVFVCLPPLSLTFSPG